MNNNQENFNDNPQKKILNNLNNQNLLEQNPNEPLNVIPNSPPPVEINQNIDNENQQIQNQNTFINNPINTNNNQINSFDTVNNNTLEEENPMLKLNQNKFIVTPEENKQNTLDSMNVNGEYNNMPKVDYSTDPKVRKNIEAINKHGAKNTVKIGSEGKVFLIIIAILLLFTFVMPTIYDAFRNAR